MERKSYREYPGSERGLAGPGWNGAAELLFGTLSSGLLLRPAALLRGGDASTGVGTQDALFAGTVAERRGRNASTTIALEQSADFLEAADLFVYGGDKLFT